MTQPSSDASFAGSIPELYERLLVPMIFQPYANDLARRVAALSPSRVLETAAGTGVVTRAMATALPPSTEIIATDLNQPMLDRAVAIGTQRPLQWQQADAMQLPFDGESFDAVVCQFGVMFFPDKARAFAEVRRVLRPGGMLLFNVWDRIENNDFANTAMAALAELFASDPPRFMARTPHGYFDQRVIAGDLAQAGFEAPPVFDVLAERSRAESAAVAATAFCQGTPMRGEIEARSTPHLGLAEVTSACEVALARTFGAGPIEGKIQAHVVTVRR